MVHSLSVPKEKYEIMEDKIEALIDTYGKDVLRTAYLYLKDMQRAEDAFQEVFIKIYQKYDSFQSKSSEKTWIMSITINVCKDMLRSSWLKRVFAVEDIKHNEGYEKATDTEALKLVENEVIFKEVLSLQQALKDVVVLYYYQEFNTKEISEILGVAEGTVRSRLHRARELLKKRLEGRVELYE